MKSFCHRAATVASLGLLSSGCAMASLEDELPTAPPLSAMEGPDGHGILNGLKPSIYQPLRGDLDHLMTMRLPPSMTLLSDPVFGDFLSTANGQKVFTYAIGCALPQGVSAGSFFGRGVMATTGSWVTGGLDQQQRDDLHTCITTRLNWYAKEVPLWVGGPDTAKDESSDVYEYSEAVWSVTVGPTSAIFSVWPASTFTLNTACPVGSVHINQEFNTRICNNNPSLCSITLRTDFATACQGQPGEGNFVCDGKPAIETRLNKLEWNAVHSKMCAIP